MSHYTPPTKIAIGNRGIAARFNDLDTAIDNGFTAAETVFSTSNETVNITLGTNLTSANKRLMKTDRGLVTFSARLVATGTLPLNAIGWVSLMSPPASCVMENTFAGAAPFVGVLYRAVQGDYKGLQIQPVVGYSAYGIDDGTLTIAAIYGSDGQAVSTSILVNDEIYVTASWYAP